MRRFALVFLWLAIALPAFAGGPPSLTGVWEGTFSCKIEDPEGKRTLKAPATLLINQLGPSGPLEVNLVSKGTGGYSGTIVPSLAKPNEGVGMLIACGTDDSTTLGEYAEFETFSYKVGSDGSGTIKASGGYTQKSQEVGVCKTTWTRTATKAPITVPCRVSGAPSARRTERSDALLLGFVLARRRVKSAPASFTSANRPAGSSWKCRNAREPR